MNKKVKTLVKLSMVTALYVAVSLLIMPFSFGAVQFRVAELFNLFVIFDKRYIYAVTLGCAITNLFSPLGIIDVIVGAGSTFIALWISEWGLRFFKKHLWQQLLWIDVVVTISTISVALELHFISHLPILATYGTVMLGEAFSLGIGTLLLLIIHHKFKNIYDRFKLND